MNLSKITLVTLMAGLSLSACANRNTDTRMGNRDDGIVVDNPVIEARISDSTDITPTTMSQDLDQLENSVYTQTDYLDMSVSAPLAPMGGDIPPNARPGECYGKVSIPAVTEDILDRIQVSQEQQVIARTIPAQYEVRKEKILVSAGRKYWKAGRGPIEQVDQLTGEIMCLIEEQPVYKVIEKRILVMPERPEYETKPAEFETVTRSRVVQAERSEWRRILCETNVTSEIIANIQQGLQAKGYDVGAIDGHFNTQTLSVINQYQ
jgi:hypothetical protein